MTQSQRRIRKAARLRDRYQHIRAMIEARKIAYFDDLNRVVEGYVPNFGGSPGWFVWLGEQDEFEKMMSGNLDMLGGNPARSPRDEKDKEKNQ